MKDLFYSVTKITVKNCTHGPDNLGSNFISATCWLCEPGQVTQPLCTLLSHQEIGGNNGNFLSGSSQG